MNSIKSNGSAVRLGIDGSLPFFLLLTYREQCAFFFFNAQSFSCKSRWSVSMRREQFGARLLLRFLFILVCAC